MPGPVQRRYPVAPLDDLPPEVVAAGGNADLPESKDRKTVRPTAAPWVPDDPRERRIPLMRERVQVCQGCELYRGATQAVFGEGAADARLLMVGEVPGDKDELQGRPFSGPAGNLLDQALEAAGIPRTEVYITNAVKHFRYRIRGKRRIHVTPLRSQVIACRPWLVSEIEAIRPRLIVGLGATASQALVGPSFRINRDRGQIRRLEEFDIDFMGTIHPSAVLRMEEPDREPAFAGLLADLRLAWARARSEPDTAA